MDSLINFKEIKNGTLRIDNFYFLLIIFFIFILDRYTKIEIGFGLFHSSSVLIYNIISIFIASVIIFLIYLIITSEKFEKISFSIIVGGALGNFYDRIVFKAVPDFIDLHYSTFHWFTFNVADIFITLGVIIFLVKGYLIKKKL